MGRSPGFCQSKKVTLILIGVLVLVIFLTSIGRLLEKIESCSPLDKNCHKSGGHNYHKDTEVAKKSKPKLILFYTTLWGSKLWSGFETTERFNNWGGYPCRVQNCLVTYNRALLPKVDVVIFHAFGGDMLTPKQLQKLSERRHRDQVWIYFMHESPHNARPSPKLANGFFNWTMNYRMDADITVLYNWEWGTWEPRTPKDPIYRERNHADSKDKLVYGGISHCGPIREKYIKKLQEYISVDIYGGCSKRFHTEPKKCERGTPECIKLLKRYKFFLAFENSFCIDYISEKYWETLLDGNAVPIVMGGAEYSKVAIPKSFIDVMDFDSVEDLANYIKYLDENDEAYNEYHAWKARYKLGQPRSWSCKICEMINSNYTRQTYHDLAGWYGIENTCGTRLDRLRTVLKNSAVEKPYTDEYYHFEWD